MFENAGNVSQMLFSVACLVFVYFVRLCCTTFVYRCCKCDSSVSLAHNSFFAQNSNVSVAHRWCVAVAYVIHQSPLHVGIAQHKCVTIAHVIHQSLLHRIIIRTYFVCLCCTSLVCRCRICNSSVSFAHHSNVSITYSTQFVNLLCT